MHVGLQRAGWYGRRDQASSPALCMQADHCQYGLLDSLPDTAHLLLYQTDDFPGQDQNGLGALYRASKHHDSHQHRLIHILIVELQPRLDEQQDRVSPESAFFSATLMVAILDVFVMGS